MAGLGFLALVRPDRNARHLFHFPSKASVSHTGMMLVCLTPSDLLGGARQQAVILSFGVVGSESESEGRDMSQSEGVDSDSWGSSRNSKGLLNQHL